MRAVAADEEKIGNVQEPQENRNLSVAAQIAANQRGDDSEEYKNNDELDVPASQTAGRSESLAEKTIRVVVLEDFKLTLLNYLKTLRVTPYAINSKWMDLLQAHLKKFDTAQGNNKLVLALGYKNLIEDIQRALEASLKEQEAKSEPEKTAWRNVAQSIEELIPINDALLEAEDGDDQEELKLLTPVAKGSVP